MKSISILILLNLFLLCSYASMGQNEPLVARNMEVVIRSNTLKKNIEARSKSAKSFWNVEKGYIVVEVPIESFYFAIPLMQDHFNRIFMESDKYPKAFFRGRILSNPDLDKDGEFLVTVKGKLTIHGEAHEKTITGLITVLNGIPSIKSDFNVSCTRHGISIPDYLKTVVSDNIRISIHGTYKPGGILSRKPTTKKE